jgi:hypothetical protein
MAPKPAPATAYPLKLPTSWGGDSLARYGSRPHPITTPFTLVAMKYRLNERLPTPSPGQHLVQVEFVAADHAPFEPRVLAQAAFQVAP